jgi:hypothetical protein
MHEKRAPCHSRWVIAVPWPPSRLPSWQPSLSAWSSGCDAGTPTTCSGCTATQPRSPATWSSGHCAVGPGAEHAYSGRHDGRRRPMAKSARWAAGEPSWSLGTWVSGWCDSACAHQAGMPWSRRCWWLPTAWPWPWPRSAGEASARRGRVGPGKPPARLACASRRHLGATKIGAVPAP